MIFRYNLFEMKYKGDFYNLLLVIFYIKLNRINIFLKNKRLGGSHTPTRRNKR